MNGMPVVFENDSVVRYFKHLKYLQSA